MLALTSSLMFLAVKHLLQFVFVLALLPALLTGVVPLNWVFLFSHKM